jgi:hypothetical protein
LHSCCKYGITEAECSFFGEDIIVEVYADALSDIVDDSSESRGSIIDEVAKRGSKCHGNT